MLYLLYLAIYFQCIFFLYNIALKCISLVQRTYHKILFFQLPVRTLLLYVINIKNCQVVLYNISCVRLQNRRQFTKPHLYILIQLLA